MVSWSAFIFASILTQHSELGTQHLAINADQLTPVMGFRPSAALFYLHNEKTSLTATGDRCKKKFNYVQLARANFDRYLREF
ncbi:MAG: hypothetical protein HC865_26195 [Cyanobacteria bacterium RU_5_0]|nr:hypothetical protein [Cyanobacteria bacterium RU_5_0]